MSRKKLAGSIQKEFTRAVGRLAGPTHSLCTDSQRYDPFFIIGSGRCGTTLLRRILQLAPGIHIPPETYVIGECARNFREFGNLGWRHLVRLTLASFDYHEEFGGWNIELRPLALELERAPREQRTLAYILNRLFHYQGESMGKTVTRWGDKTPINYRFTEDILQVFPDARFVHLMRDGVDVVHSIRKAGLTPDIPSAAERWIEGTTLAHQFAQKHPGICMEVRYEDLVMQPDQYIKKVCGFLDIEFTERMIQQTGDEKQVGDVLTMSHHENVMKPINTGSVGKGRANMPESDKRDLQKLIGDELERFGYKPAH